MHTLAPHDHNHQEARETLLSFEHERKKRVLTLYHTLWRSIQELCVEEAKMAMSYGGRSTKSSRPRGGARYGDKRQTLPLSLTLPSSLVEVLLHSLLTYDIFLPSS